jgi:hypothetical protein
LHVLAPLNTRRECEFGEGAVHITPCPYDRLLKEFDWFLLVQDDIRLTSRLTMDVGLGYQWFNHIRLSSIG